MLKIDTFLSVARNDTSVLEIDTFLSVARNDTSVLKIDTFLSVARNDTNLITKNSTKLLVAHFYSWVYPYLQLDLDTAHYLLYSF